MRFQHAVMFVLLVATRLAAADYTVPGTTATLPLIAGMVGDPEVHGVVKAGETFPRVSISVMRRLGRERVFKDQPAYTRQIDGHDFDFLEAVKEKDGTNLTIVMASARLGEQAITVTGMFVTGDEAQKDAVTQTIMGARFGDKLIASPMDWLPISFEVIPDLEVMMLAPGALTLTGKDQTVDNGKGMMVLAFLQELTPNERDEVLQGTCRQMAEKHLSAKPEDGKLEKLTLGQMSGYRFTVAKNATAKLPGSSVCAVAKDGITVIIVPFKAGAEETPLITRQIAKMKSSLKPRKK